MASHRSQQPALSTVDALTQLSFLLHGRLENHSRAADLSIVQGRLLGILRDRRPTMGELTKFLDLDKSSVTGLVDRAERRGLVRRCTDDRDRRATVVEITDLGRDLITSATTAYSTELTALVAHLRPHERDTLTDLATRLLIVDAQNRGVDLFADLTDV